MLLPTDPWGHESSSENQWRKQQVSDLVIPAAFYFFLLITIANALGLV